MRPTTVLTHGAFAESASWNGVNSRLQSAGHRTVAFVNPLRGLSGAAAVSNLLDTIEGPIVFVGDSNGGAVATSVAATV